MKKRRSHPRYSVPSLGRGALAGTVAGLLASWVKAQAEPPLQRWGEQQFPPLPAEKIQRGSDVSGHPENMPPAVLAQRVSQMRWHHTLTARETKKSMTAIHYTFGVLFGVGYGVVAEKQPAVTSVGGLLAGATLWAATHGSTLPTLKLQAAPNHMPKAWFVWELGSHLVYGLALEGIRRGVRRWIVDYV